MHMKKVLMFLILMFICIGAKGEEQKNYNYIGTFYKNSNELISSSEDGSDFLSKYDDKNYKEDSILLLIFCDEDESAEIGEKRKEYLEKIIKEKNEKISIITKIVFSDKDKAFKRSAYIVSLKFMNDITKGTYDEHNMIYNRAGEDDKYVFLLFQKTNPTRIMYLKSALDFIEELNDYINAPYIDPYFRKRRKKEKVEIVLDCNVTTNEGEDVIKKREEISKRILKENITFDYELKVDNIEFLPGYINFTKAAVKIRMQACYIQLEDVQF